MASTVDVANLALGRLRVSKFINDLSDQNTQAGICNRFMDQCRKEVLREFPWGFSTKAVELSQVADQTFPGWTYVYAYPDDCLMLRAVADENGLRFARQYAAGFAGSGGWGNWNYFDEFTRQNPFQLALKDDSASQVVLSDIPSAWGFFTVDVTGVGLMPPDFISVWADRLAMEVGGPLQADQGAIDAASTRYYIRLSRASAKNFNEGKDDVRPDSPSIQCRY